MNNRILSVISAFAVLAFVGLASAEETLESVEKNILESLGKHTSWAGQVTVTFDMQEPDFRMSGTKRGLYEYAKKKRRIMFRRELNITGVEVIDGQESKFQESETRICDGQFVHTLTENMGRQTATKVRARPGRIMGASKSLFRRWHRLYDLKLLPDESVHGDQAYVIEAKPKLGDPGLPARTLFYFSKNSGILIKRVHQDDKGKTTESTTFSSIILNPEIDPQRFVFEAPDGIEIIEKVEE